MEEDEVRYRYEVRGTAQGGQTWTSSGHVETAKSGDFPRVMDTAMRLSFVQLTNGQAVYGQPGVGCKGPYGISRMLIELEDGS